MAMTLCIVVPCYNEAPVLAETNRRLLSLLTGMRESGLIGDGYTMYVDDGSQDGSWELIESLARTDSRVHGLKLSRNRGHQCALLAGLLSARADAVVTIDADLQDDVSVIEKMVREHLDGAEIVYGVRRSRAVDTVFKRTTAEWYYRLMRRMGVDLVSNHADFRLMGRRSIAALAEFSEVNLFLRGIVPLIGFRSITIGYDRAERFAGETKYNLRRMLSFAVNGITSFSVVPLRLITLVGLIVSACSFLVALYVFFGWVFRGHLIPGWASSVISVYFLGGIQLLSIGVLGEYVSKMYLETKRRPRYFVEKEI